MATHKRKKKIEPIKGIYWRAVGTAVGTAIFFLDVECLKIAFALNKCCLFFIDAVIFILFVVLLQKQSFFSFFSGFWRFSKS